MQDLVNQMPGAVNQMQGMMPTLLPDWSRGCVDRTYQVQKQVEELTRRVEALESQMKGKKK